MGTRSPLPIVKKSRVRVRQCNGTNFPHQSGSKNVTSMFFKKLRTLLPASQPNETTNMMLIDSTRKYKSGLEVSSDLDPRTSGHWDQLSMHTTIFLSFRAACSRIRQEIRSYSRGRICSHASICTFPMINDAFTACACDPKTYAGSGCDLGSPVRPHGHLLINQTRISIIF